MAYVYKNPEDEQEAAAAMGTRTPSAPTPSATGVPGSAPVAGAPAPAAGGFIGFDKYFAANQQTAGNTADRLASSVESQGRAASGATQKMAGDFYRDAAAGGLNSASGQYVTQSGNSIDGRPGKPISLADAELAATRTYTGPKDMASMNGYDAAFRAAKDAQERTSTLGTHSGTAAQLAGMQAGSYSQGQSDLDAALVNRSGGNRFSQLRSQYGGLSNYLDGANKASSEYGTRMQDTVAGTAKGYQNLAESFRNAETVRDENDASAVAHAKAEAARISKLAGDAQKAKWREQAAVEEWKKEQARKEDDESREAHAWDHRTGGSIS